ACDGADTTFTFSFGIDTTADLQVILITAATGAESTLTLTTDYTVTSANANDPQDFTAGGTVTLTAAPSAAYEILLRRNTAKTQTANIDDEEVEEGLDKLTRISQDLSEWLGRSLYLPKSETGTSMQLAPVATRASKYLGFDANGAPVYVAGTNIDPDHYQAIFDNRDYANLAAAITAIGATVGELHIWDAETLTANAVFPATLGVVIHKGGSIIKASTYTLTISGPFDAGLYQVFSGFTTVTLSQVKQVYPQWFGATGDGTTNDTAAITVAITAALASESGHLNGLTTYSHPCVYFPKGVYSCETALTADVAGTVIFIDIRSEGAILVAGSGITLFGGVAGHVKISGLQFHGGATAISIKTNNTDASTIEIAGNYFLNQTASAIKSDTVSNSTKLSIHHNTMVNYQAASHVLDLLSSDYVEFCDNWVEPQSTTVFVLNNGNAVFERNTCVPLGEITRWFQCNGGLRISRCGFSGENTVHSFVDFNSPASVLHVSDSSVFTSGTEGYGIKFYALPQSLTWERNTGTYGFAGLFWFDPSISVAEVTAFLDRNNNDIRIDHPDVVYAGADSNGVAMAVALEGRRSHWERPFDLLSPTDLVATFGGFWDATNSTATPAATTDTYGNSTYRWTATADNQRVEILWNTTLASCVTGVWYTMIETIVVDSNQPLQVVLYAGAASKSFNLPRGAYNLCMPFRFASNQRTGIAVEKMPDTATMYYGAGYVVRGVHYSTTYPIRWYATAAPATLAHTIGEECINSDPDAGEPSKWLCTAAGTPGTWLPTNPIQSANAYTTTNVTATRALDANGGDIAVVSDVLATLIEDLKTAGVLKAP
ncbi:MAG: hypothetical protein EHM35_02850, partial [Planctomycetaceae bacterium]